MGSNKLTRIKYEIISIFILGIGSGTAVGIITSIIGAWFRSLGLSTLAIGLFGIVNLPYALKFLWAPIIDTVPIFWLSKKLGKRRSWLITTQICLAFSIIIFGFSNPIKHIYLSGFLALLVAFFSASQDIVIDAYRIELLSDQAQGGGASFSILGYRCGLLISSGAALILVDYLCYAQNICEHSLNWSLVLILLSIIVLCSAISVLFMKEPTPLSTTELLSIKHWKFYIIKPFTDLTLNSQWFIIILLIVLYRLSDCFIIGMVNPFLIDMGFSLTQIGILNKTIGTIAAILGSFLGALLVYRLGSKNSLIIGVIFEMLTNFIFLTFAKTGYNLDLFYTAVIAQNITNGVSRTCAIVYASKLCKKTDFTATQYGLMASFMSIGRILASITAGGVANWLGWIGFFEVSIIINLIPLFLIYFYIK